jgi:hypothetical protein
VSAGEEQHQRISWARNDPPLLGAALAGKVAIMGPTPPLSGQNPVAKWRRRILILLAGAVVIAGGYFGVKWSWAEWTARQAEADLHLAIAEVSAAEPNGWQLEDLQRQREKIPDEQNSALVVIKAAKLLPANWAEPLPFEILDSPPPCQLLPDHAKSLATVLQTLEPTLEVARTLTRYPCGRYPPMQLGLDQLNFVNPHDQDPRAVACALAFDAVYQADNGKFDAAWQSALAALHAARSIGDEPSLLSQLIRTAARVYGILALEHVLGRGTVEEAQLSRARELLAQETSGSLMSIGVRGERASLHDFYSRLLSGQTKLEEVIKLHEVDDEIRRAILAGNEPARRANIAGSHAYMLRTLTQILACAERPPAERRKCLQDWGLAIKDDKERNRTPLLASILNPVSARVYTSEEENIARLHCAWIALAAEQFRLQERRWPRDPLELVASRLLPQHFIDPFDDQPIRFRHAPDGIVVYLVGSGKNYDGKSMDNLAQPNYTSQPHLEFRLWNPKHRAQPPIPPRRDDAP